MGARATKRTWWRRIGLSVIVVVLGLVLVAVGVEWRATSPRPATSAASRDGTPMPRRETRSTLDPALFTGKAAEAYRVAREMPEVLDQLHCYCACGSQYGHVSLLSCYADGHGST
jgi:Protein of unknown function with PCYCGC motif